MQIKDLLAIYRNIDSEPYQTLINIGVIDYSDKYNFGDDKLFWISGTKKALRLCHNLNDTYSIKVIDNYGPKARGEARYSHEYYGPYMYENDALKACIEIVREYL